MPAAFLIGFCILSFQKPSLELADNFTYFVRANQEAARDRITDSQFVEAFFSVSGALDVGQRFSPFLYFIIKKFPGLVQVRDFPHLFLVAGKIQEGTSPPPIKIPHQDLQKVLSRLRAARRARHPLPRFRRSFQEAKRESNFVVSNTALTGSRHSATSRTGRKYFPCQDNDGRAIAWLLNGTGGRSGKSTKSNKPVLVRPILYDRDPLDLGL